MTLIGRVGDDVAGRAAAEALRAEGVDVRLAVDPARATGTCVVLVEPGGERTMLPDAGANAALEPAPLPGGATHLHVAGYALLHPGSRPAARAMLAAALAAGLTVSVDPSSAAPLARAGPDAFLAWIAGAELLLPNRDEAAALSGRADPAEAARALAAHAREVVVKLGADGALWTDGGALVRVPAAPVAGADTTGAGDAFAAGLLAARLDGAGPATRCARGARSRRGRSRDRVGDDVQPGRRRAPVAHSGRMRTPCLLLAAVAALLVLAAPAGARDKRVDTSRLVAITAPPPEHRADPGLRTYVFRFGPHRIGPYQVARATDIVSPPPVGGAIVGMDTRLVTRSGVEVPQHEVMLHHIVYTDGGRHGGRLDRICPERPIAQRFYGTSEELRPLTLPAGYGYPDPAPRPLARELDGDEPPVARPRRAAGVPRDHRPEPGRHPGPAAVAQRAAVRGQPGPAVLGPGRRRARLDALPLARVDAARCRAGSWRSAATCTAAAGG